MSERIEDLVSAASAAQLCRMLRLADEDQAKGDSAVESFADATEFAAVLEEIDDEGMDAASLVTVLFTEDIALALLQSVQNVSRRLRKLATTVAQKEAADLLYQAVIAAGHLRLGINLGSRPIAARRALFMELAGKLGRSDLGQLFARAAE